MEQNNTERIRSEKEMCTMTTNNSNNIRIDERMCGWNKTHKANGDIQWQNERDGTIKRAALGMFIIQEEKQKITISHNMLNSLNDTIAHTAHWRCTRACAHTPSPAAAQLLGPGCIVIYVWYRMQRAICFRPTNRNPF